MVAIVCSKAPALFVPPKEKIVYHRPHTTVVTPLSSLTNEIGELGEVVRSVLSRLLTRLLELSISFRSIDLNVEQDPEMDWKYVVVKVKLEIDEKALHRHRDSLLKQSYSHLSAEDAKNVLLILESV